MAFLAHSGGGGGHDFDPPHSGGGGGHGFGKVLPLPKIQSWEDFKQALKESWESGKQGFLPWFFLLVVGLCAWVWFKYLRKFFKRWF